MKRVLFYAGSRYHAQLYDEHQLIAGVGVDEAEAIAEMEKTAKRLGVLEPQTRSDR